MSDSPTPSVGRGHSEREEISGRILKTLQNIAFSEKGGLDPPGILNRRSASFRSRESE